MTAESFETIEIATLGVKSSTSPENCRFAADGGVGNRFAVVETGDLDYFPSGLSPIAELAWELGLADPD
ncbi:MAG TPA: hypothetical protein PKY77_04825 [Phycisphaerae bacterium]|nr:hypothetical protein [Phycisphaerae bacterium]HRY67184.1 hypothetical protein [Phycisphaerae bacterium]HSA26447.1 hypothetical protein [Phycisphaerae bacterium]